MVAENNKAGGATAAVTNVPNTGGLGVSGLGLVEQSIRLGCSTFLRRTHWRMVW